MHGVCRVRRIRQAATCELLQSQGLHERVWNLFSLILYINSNFRSDKIFKLVKGTNKNEYETRVNCKAFKVMFV